MAKPDPTRALLKSGLQRYKQGQYYEAIGFYQKALAIDSTLSEAHYYLGDCYQYLFQYEKALEHYQQMQPSQEGEYPLLPLNLGLVHKSLGNYERAESYFQYFIRNGSQQAIPDREYWLEKAEGELINLKAVQHAPFAPVVNISISQLPGPINSNNHDIAAIPYPEADGIIVTSTRTGSKGNQYHDQHGESFSDNFLFIKDSAGWKESTDLHRFSVINTSLDEGPGSLSSDGREYYFTRFTTKGDYHIFISNWGDNQWKSPRPLSAPVNLPGYISKHPALSESGDTLFFSSNRPGGFGESDIWMSVKVEGDWQSPVNLGSAVNTAYQETAPHWNAQQRSVYFASNGHPGWGGFDIFLTPLMPEGLPERVVNIGKPLNSSKDDTYIWVGEQMGYVTSNRGNASAGFDIFQYQYDNEPKLLLSLTSKSLWETWETLSYFLPNEENPSEAFKYFSSLPTDEQKALQRTVQRRIFEAILSEQNLSAVISDESQLLLATHKRDIQELVKDQLLFYQSFEIPAWHEDSLHWFSTLSPDEQKSIEQIVQTRVMQVLLDQTETASVNASFKYEELSSEQRTWVDEATQRGVKYFREVANELISVNELINWQTLSSEEKKQLKQELSYRYFNTILSSNETPEQARHQYIQLPTEMQKQIDKMAHQLVFREKQQESGMLNEGAFRMDTLSSEEQRMIAGLILFRAEELRRQEGVKVDSGIRTWEELPQEEKTMIQRVIATRKFTKRMITEFTPTEAITQRQINLHALLRENPDVVTIRGKVLHGSSTDEPILVTLGSQQRTTTQPDGTFVFEKVKFSESQQLFLGEKENTMTEMLAISLEELEVTVVQDSQFVEVFDNIYFESNSYQLPNVGISVLDSIVNFHHRHPDIKIQIHAYADSVGGQTYNYQLSKRRGNATYQRLIQKGVDSFALEIMPMGKEAWNGDTTLSYSRRVEFVITGINTLYNPTRLIYLLAAEPDLKVLANRYGITLDQIQSTNPGMPLKPTPYTIVKIAKKAIQDEP